MGDWEAKGFLPSNSAQTNNRAELLAMITALDHFILQTMCLAVVMDSQYVYNGLRGLAFRWPTAGWVPPSGPVCNVDLWIRALDLVDTVSATVKWIWVPSHTDILGNERADVLAEEGRVSLPLYHVLSLPDRPVVSLELSSTPTPRRALAVPRSLRPPLMFGILLMLATQLLRKMMEWMRLTLCFVLLGPHHHILR